MWLAASLPVCVLRVLQKLKSDIQRSGNEVLQTKIDQKSAMLRRLEEQLYSLTGIPAESQVSTQHRKEREKHSLLCFKEIFQNINVIGGYKLLLMPGKLFPEQEFLLSCHGDDWNIMITTVTLKKGEQNCYIMTASPHE